MLDIQKDYANKTLQEAKELYHKIRNIYDSTGYSRSYQMSQIWEPGSFNIGYLTNIINSDASPVDSYRLSNVGHFSLNPSDAVKEKTVDWYIAYLERHDYDISELDINIQESPVTDPTHTVQRASRVLTPDLMRRIILYLEIQKYCSLPKSNQHFVELGGGCGHLARTFKLFIPNSVYVLIDIPETLYFAYLFLKLSFPNAKTCYVTDQSQLKGSLEDFDFVFVPTMFAETTLEYEFDLFCNTASLGEMTNPVIRYWMDFVQNRLKVKYFFGLNRFLNRIDLDDPYGKQRLDENECSVLFDAKWKILKWELEPSFARCPYRQTMVSRNLEIIAERLPEDSVNDNDNRLRSRQIVEDLMDEDWICLPDSYFSSTMGNDVLAHDLTMDGTLFKLWDSIRLHPNTANVAMMIIYLHTLAKGGHPFEELFYYRNLLNTLVSSGQHLEQGYEDLWKQATALSKSYETFSIIGFVPSSIRHLLVRLLRPATIRLGKVAHRISTKLRRARLY